MLKTPWNVDMIGRPYPYSTATAWTFIDTSRRPNPVPKMNRESMSSSIVGGSGSTGSDRQSTTAATRITLGLPHSRINQPVVGIARIAPTDVLKSATPSRASSSPKLFWTAGMRATQLPSDRA